MNQILLIDAAGSTEATRAGGSLSFSAPSRGRSVLRRARHPSRARSALGFCALSVQVRSSFASCAEAPLATDWGDQSVHSTHHVARNGAPRRPVRPEGPRLLPAPKFPKQQGSTKEPTLAERPFPRRRRPLPRRRRAARGSTQELQNARRLKLAARKIELIGKSALPPLRGKIHCAPRKFSTTSLMGELLQPLPPRHVLGLHAQRVRVLTAKFNETAVRPAPGRLHFHRAFRGGRA